MLKRAWLLLPTFIIGFVAGFAWRSFPLLHVHAEGELKFEKPQDPALTPTDPPGYYVLSRVYISGADASSLGRSVFASGALTTHDHPETQSFPMLPFGTAGSTSP